MGESEIVSIVVEPFCVVHMFPKTPQHSWGLGECAENTTSMGPKFHCIAKRIEGRLVAGPIKITSYYQLSYFGFNYNRKSTLCIF